jgi:uncharacterized protein involved in exopolysaccharide biosynthesis
MDTRSDVIDLLEYWSILWRRKKLIIGLFVVAVAVAVVLSFALPPYFRSETVLMASGTEAGGLGAALSAIPLAGALSAGSGIQLPSDKVLVVLNSRTIAELVIARFDLLRVFNEDEWDREKKAWKDPDDPPLLQDAVRLLRDDVVSISRNKEGAIAVTVTWKDAQLASDIANHYVAATTQVLNEKAITVTVQIVDRAVPAQRKHSPKMTLLAALAGLLSLFFGIVAAFVLESRQQRHTE